MLGRRAVQLPVVSIVPIEYDLGKGMFEAAKWQPEFEEYGG